MPWRNNVTAQSKERELAYFFQEICTRVKFDTITWDPGSVPSSSTLTTALAAATYPEVTGLRSGMPVKVTPPSTLPAGMTVDAYVATDDTLTIVLSNFTSGAIDIGSTAWAFMGVIL